MTAMVGRGAAGLLCRGVLAAGVATALVLAPVAGRAAEPPPLPPVLLSSGAAVPAVLLRRVAEPAPVQAEMPPEVQQSLGCAIAGGAGTAAAVLAGGENLVNIIAGGVVMPQNRAVLYIGLVGVVFASFCAIGQALTPLYLYAVAAPDAGSAEASRPVARAAAPSAAPPPLLRTGLSAHGPLAAMLGAPAPR